jgi:hypothetical protein
MHPLRQESDRLLVNTREPAEEGHTLSQQGEYVRRLFAGREIDPVEAASIHIALQELQERSNSYLEIEIAEDDTAERIEANCRAIAHELCMRLLFEVIATRHVAGVDGRPTSEPSLMRVSLDRVSN